MSEIKARLEAEATRLRAHWAKLDAHRRSGLPIDSEDAAVAMDDDEVVDELEHKARTDLAAIESALRRVEAGTYGRCVVCDTEIPARRMEAMPFTDHCAIHGE